MPQGGTCPQNRIRKHLKYQYKIFKTRIYFNSVRGSCQEKNKNFYAKILRPVRLLLSVQKAQKTADKPGSVRFARGVLKKSRGCIPKKGSVLIFEHGTLRR